MAGKVLNIKVCSPLELRSSLTRKSHATCHYPYNLPLVCIDGENSDAKRNALGNLKFKSFSIDENKTWRVEIFRLDEKGWMIIINKRVYQVLSKAGLKGVIIENTEKFDGYGI